MKQKKQRRRRNQEPKLREGYTRVYFDLPNTVYAMFARNAKKHGMDVGAYIMGRGLAAPIEVSGDFVTAEMAASAAATATTKA